MFLNYKSYPDLHLNYLTSKEITMEEFSQTTVWDLLKIMQQKVKDNAEVIQKNVKSAELVKEKYDKSKKRDKIIESIYQQNFELTQENTNLLELHNYLYKFYKDFKYLLNKSYNIDPSEKKKKYRESCMIKSISGELEINWQHPFANDAEFMNDLMFRCKNMELYERCSEIKKVKSKSKVRS